MNTAIKMKNIFVSPQIVSHTEVHEAHFENNHCRDCSGIAGAQADLLILVSVNLGQSPPPPRPPAIQLPQPNLVSHLCPFISQAFTVVYIGLGPVLGAEVTGGEQNIVLAVKKFSV